MARTQAINRAYSILGNEERRREYDQQLDQAEKEKARNVRRPVAANIKKDIHLGMQDLIRGIELNVSVNDPAGPSGEETYRLVVPPETPPGVRFRLKRTAPFVTGYVDVRVKVRPDARFKAKGSDVKFDLRINNRRATSGGVESIRGPTGNTVLVKIPPKVRRDEIIRVSGEGLPKPRGGRGDLLVRIRYQPEVRFAPAGKLKTPGPDERRGKGHIFGLVNTAPSRMNAAS